MYPYLEYRNGDEAGKDNAFRDRSSGVQGDVGPALSPTFQQDPEDYGKRNERYRNPKSISLVLAKKPT